MTLVEPDDMVKIVHSLKSNAPGLDGVTVHMLLLCLPYCKDALCHIINCSLQTGKVPTIWKAAKIIPLRKKDDSLELKDLRPISILPPGSKVLEKIVHYQVTQYLEMHHILLNIQSGFRKNFSTTTALLKINDDIFRALDNSLITIIVLLDMSKAFDSINHDLLLSKLHYYGIKDNS